MRTVLPVTLSTQVVRLIMPALPRLMLSRIWGSLLQVAITKMVHTCMAVSTGSGTRPEKSAQQAAAKAAALARASGRPTPEYLGQAG
jgi:hypothetical protein